MPASAPAPAPAPQIIVIPQSQQTTIAKPPTFSHTSNYVSSNNNNYQIASKPQTSTSTHKPIGGFRIRLYWEKGYRWQNDPTERYWCMECRGGCNSGSSIQIDRCDSSTRQKFIAVARTIRPASNPALCLTVTGYSGKGAPVRLRRCNRGSNQNFMEVRSYGRFELQPQKNHGRCLSQHHHPKRYEVVYPENCSKTRRFDTTYWTTH